MTLLVDDFDRPNGLCFSPDESILYINDTERMHIRAFDVQPDGTIVNDRVFGEEEGDNGKPDGMKVDTHGMSISPVLMGFGFLHPTEHISESFSSLNVQPTWLGAVMTGQASSLQRVPRFIAWHARWQESRCHNADKS